MVYIQHKQRLFTLSTIDPVGAQATEEGQFVRVMRTGAWKGSQIDGEQVVLPTTRAPRGETRGDVLAMLEIVDCCTQLGSRIRPVYQNARITGVELPGDGLRTAAARVRGLHVAQGAGDSSLFMATPF